MNQSFKTAEFVSPKHPDKLCDRIADAILDAHLAADSNARTAIEVMGGHGRVYITGEITSQAVIDIAPIVERIAGPGLEIIENIAVQSPEIAAGVDAGGAGDQGVMIGYATLAQRIAAWIKGPKQMKALNKVFGSLFMLVGALLASARHA